MKKLVVECIGTAWLVLGGCGSAVLAAAYPELGIGFVGVSLAFGLTVLTMVYAIGHISGCHLNPAVSVGLWIGGRFDKKDLLPYIIAQIIGGTIGASVIYIVAIGNGVGDIGSFAANGYGVHSPGGYDMISALVIEAVLTFMFLFIILGATHPKAPKGFAGIAIGLALTLIHLISIPVTNTSVNPARSISQAVFVQGWAIDQLWLFIVAPIVGAAVAGAVYTFVSKE